MPTALRDLVGPNPALRRVEAGWFLVNLAEWMFITALSIHEYQTHGALALGLIGARFAPGAVLGSLLLGPATRRRPPAMLGVLAVLCAVTVAAAAAVVALGGPLALIILLVWFEAIIAMPYRPVQSSMLPALSDTPRQLSAVAGGIPAAKAIAWAAGALLGSLGLAVAAPQTVVLVAAGALLVAALLARSLQTGTPAGLIQPPGQLPGHEGRYAAVRAGFQLIAQRARPLLTLGGARSLTRGLWTALTVVTSLDLLHLGSSGVGVLMAAAGIGAATAVPMSLRFAGRRHLAGPTTLAFALAGLPIVVVGVVARTVPAIVLIVIWGAAFALADSLSNSLVHRVVEARQLAPSVAAIEASKLLLEGIGALLAPLLLELFGVRDALLVAGAPLPILALISRHGLGSVDRRADNRIRPLSALRRTPSFRGMTMLSLENLASRLERTTAATGEAVVKQGEVGDRFYLIDQGSVEVTVDGFRVAVLGPGGSFGEKALLRAVPRSATVTALAPTTLWYLGGSDFMAAATGDEGPVAPPTFLRTDVRSLEEMLSSVPLLTGIDPSELAGSGAIIDVRQGDAVVGEGEVADRFYVILFGLAEVTMGGESVRTLSAGDWFGEIALLHDLPRTATVTAARDLRLWALERDAFWKVLRDAAAGGTSGDGGTLSGAGLLV